ncbi:death-associated inhibitor of apoptosis 1-like isoform X1 [Aphis gossypii]|uniref:death-associated inhibitor of apoptosis 1-like n=2 Tax=Aphis gossypii TaxID=80765 RepID=UPI0021597E4F|nr:death-associated inhibitor of apoptosis 1-like isoform X1 [Aphis gossypii]XP_050057851.1 death-associated inhibitor of apoptosis 1-like isoform X1 [Aphis gossypii]XP_050062282.1 death-associated inhibitor of apoptosis 1-like isoform X1 [Aphis gossypii]XP_050063833.1 death-associated inhibitor of apoptosis 1-like isoform X1 [Aphis gossypii]XP_050064569.1 death-associated inhibitor of apoptosis 1-like isoform X1 [Aphis gossypii]XP_050065123.1 death-associated inhibitor of apoptosis 1-like iso
MNFQQINNSFCSLVSLVRNNAYPTYPEFTTFISRLKTFNLFPLTSSQDKYSLAESGFIYSGKKDIVECFCCGIILHRWEKEDNPWIEHSRWNPKCVFVLLSKGNQFVENVVKKYGSIELGSYSNIQSEDCSFMYELLQFHFNSLSNMILQDLVM